MTTPEGPIGAEASQTAIQPVSPERITRPEPAREGPVRSGATRAAESQPAPPPPPPHHASPDATIDATVAKSVKTAYDVLAHTIEQGRKSALHFRQGEYNMRDVPDDVRHLALRMLGLARQLSNSTFDVCQALLKQAPAVGMPPPPGATHVPPFQAVKPMAAAAAQQPHEAAPQAPQPTMAAPMRLAVKFEGPLKGVAHTASVDRPSVAVDISDVKCMPLAMTGTDYPPIETVTFEPNLAEGGLVATVTVTPDIVPGTYCGIVYTMKQQAPLGMLVVELTK